MALQLDRLQIPDTSSAFNSGFREAFNTSQTISKDIQAGREKATLNKLYGEALNPEGQLDTNKLTQGLASSGLGARIPELLSQQQDAEIGKLKIGKATIDQSLSHLGIIGQVMGSVTNKSDYLQGLSTLKEQGIDVSKYPNAMTDDEAKQTASFALNNAISASDKLQNDYKNSELFTRLQKYQTELETSARKENIQQQQFQQQQETVRRGQDISSADRSLALEDRRMLAEEKKAATKSTELNKPMPASYAKQYSEITDKETGQAGNISKIDELLSNPALEKLTPINAATANLQNIWSATTSDVSKYAAELKSGVANIINEDLRLNKGVQTDKDWSRAKDALIKSTSVGNPEIIKQALGNYKEQQARLLASTQKNKELIERQFPYQTTGTMPTTETTKSLASQLSKIPADIDSATLEAYKQHLINKGYK